MLTYRAWIKETDVSKVSPLPPPSNLKILGLKSTWDKFSLFSLLKLKDMISNHPPPPGHSSLAVIYWGTDQERGWGQSLPSPHKLNCVILLWNLFSKSTLSFLLPICPATPSFFLRSSSHPPMNQIKLTPNPLLLRLLFKVRIGEGGKKSMNISGAGWNWKHPSVCPSNLGAPAPMNQIKSTFPLSLCSNSIEGNRSKDV